MILPQALGGRRQWGALDPHSPVKNLKTKNSVSIVLSCDQRLEDQRPPPTMTTPSTRAPGHILIFLDIDGVLLPFPNSEKSSCGAIFPDDCLAALSQILFAFPDARLILSSTWRAQPSCWKLSTTQWQRKRKHELHLKMLSSFAKMLNCISLPD